MKKIVFCGGGSAGHVIPNIAIIEELKDKFAIEYIGTDGIEKDICENFGLNFHFCGAVKLVRGKIISNIALPFRLFKCTREAGKILDEIKPDLLFCKGGYVCVPAALAASRRGIPIISHESDISPGLANRFISRKCKKVLTSFPSTAKKFERGIYTGTPMRKELSGRSRAAALQRYKLDMRPTLLVLGGGSGSRVINDCIRKIASDVCKDYNILHICGKNNLMESNIYGYRQIEFENDMGLAYACADAAVSRCGSNAANELISLKIPTLFIPLENKRSRGDQVENAAYFENLGLCRVLKESEMNESSLKSGVRSLFKDCELKKALDRSAVKSGNEKIVREIVTTLNSEVRTK